MTLQSKPADPNRNAAAPQRDPHKEATTPISLNISIINYRTADTTQRCLDALTDACNPLPSTITIVDTASAAGSPAAIANWIATP